MRWHTCMHIHMCAYVCLFCVRACASACYGMHVFEHTSKCACVHAWIQLCPHIHINLCMRVFINICMRICICMSMATCMRIWMYACMWCAVCMHAGMHVRASTSFVSTSLDIYMHVLTSMCVCVFYAQYNPRGSPYVHAYNIHMLLCMNVFVHGCLFACINTKGVT